MLNDWSGIDIPSAVKFLHASQSFDGGFGQCPGQESHGGSTYCALASFWLLGEIHNVKKKEILIEWLLHRQELGFHGRINKPDDTCYAFWIGASLDVSSILSADGWKLSIC